MYSMDSHRVSSESPAVCESLAQLMAIDNRLSDPLDEDEMKQMIVAMRCISVIGMMR
jgi:hypothetical protein